MDARDTPLAYVREGPDAHPAMDSPDHRGYRFDIPLQGADETVFFAV